MLINAWKFFSNIKSFYKTFVSSIYSVIKLVNFVLFMIIFI